MNICMVWIADLNDTLQKMEQLMNSENTRLELFMTRSIVLLPKGCLIALPERLHLTSLFIPI